jgi:hypothetical protein
MNPTRKTWRRGVLALVAGAWLTLPGCNMVDQLLEAENPGAIDESQLDDPALIRILVNSVRGALGALYDDPFIWTGSLITDEQVTGINWENTARLNQRIVRFDQGDAASMFNMTSRFRFMGDSVAGRLRNLLPNPNSDERMALVLAHAGYGYTLMAEVMCQATINVGAEIYTPVQLAQLAIPRFEEAITVANAANRPQIANLARTGLARAALLAGDNARVMAAAANVPLNFAWWVEYDNTGQVNQNTMFVRITGGNHALGVHPRFLNGPFRQQNIVATQTDPRIQHTTRWTTGHNALTPLYKPYQSLPYSGYNGATIATGGTPVFYEQGTNIKLASGLEAMHHYYEAAGPNGTGPLGTTLAFVNARRAYGNQAPVNLSGAELMAELREQRARDLYLGGFRLGDLRRWKQRGIGDFFPSGPHVNESWGLYGDAECFPLPLSEYVGNPNIRLN